jgi:hypothetical protein
VLECEIRSCKDSITSLRLPLPWFYRCFQSALYTCSTGSLFGINFLDVFPLGQCTLVGSQTSLGILVNSLIGRRTSRLDHVQNSALIRCQSYNFTSNFSTEGSSLSGGLKIEQVVVLEEGGRDKETKTGHKWLEDVLLRMKRLGLFHKEMAQIMNWAANRTNGQNELTPFLREILGFLSFSVVM